MKIIQKYNYCSWTHLFPFFFVCLNLVIRWMLVTEICETWWFFFQPPVPGVLWWAEAYNSYMENHERHPRRIEALELLDWMIHLTIISAAVTLSSFQKLILWIFSWEKKPRTFCWIRLVLVSFTSVGPVTFLCCRQNAETAGRVHSCFPTPLWITQEISALQRPQRARKLLIPILCSWQRQERKVVNWNKSLKKEESKGTDKRSSMEMCFRKMLTLISGMIIARSYDYSMRISNWEEVEKQTTTRFTW